MAKVIGFEGCIGAGKTTLTNYFSHELNLPKVLEEVDGNPFLKPFYKGLDVNLEVELTFLMLHYSLLKEAFESCKEGLILTDFSIEKDLVFARLNMTGRKLEAFEQMYQYTIGEIGLPWRVMFLDLSSKTLRRRIFQRGRPYELDAGPAFFTQYHRRIREHFNNDLQGRVSFFEVDDLVLDSENDKLREIENAILKVVNES